MATPSFMERIRWSLPDSDTKKADSQKESAFSFILFLFRNQFANAVIPFFTQMFLRLLGCLSHTIQRKHIPFHMEIHRNPHSASRAGHIVKHRFKSICLQKRFANLFDLLQYFFIRRKISFTAQKNILAAPGSAKATPSNATTWST